MVYLALRGFPRAPLVAVLIGSWSAVLIASAHFAPHWGAFSDSYWDLKPDAFSWAAAAAEVIAALILFLVGLRTLRQQRAAPAIAPANSISA
jgi:ABC-type branched-subunit amino acid transport system permease subunit